MLNYSANGPSGYNLTRSLRFRASASAYLNRTFTTPTSATIFTWSGWVKRGTLGTVQAIFSATSGGTNSSMLFFDNTDVLGFYWNNGATVLTTTAVFRDPSAWYHIVFYVSGATQRIYVNNQLLASTTTGATPIYLNTALPHYLSYQVNQTRYVDGYMAEVNFIDGQALTPSSFGQTSSTTGVWIPKKYTGTYGTNGFYLPFTDNSSTTSGSNVGLGKDFSGNGNFWNTNNISVTAGTTYDSMTDVPTLTSTTAANYCVVSPIAFRTTTPSPTITNGNLTVVCPSATASAIGSSTFGVSSGKWYWEATKTGTAYGNTGIALAPFSQTISALKDFGSESNEYAYINNGQKYNNNSASAYGSSFTDGDVIGIALDLDAGTLTFYKNNVSQGVAYSSLPSGTYIVGCYDSYNGSGFQFNFGQRPFAYTAPTGFNPVNAYNLSTPTIGATTTTQANKYMDATLYTGNGSNPRTITNATSFYPDLVWVKDRTTANWNILSDTVRGANNVLYSNSNAVQQINEANGYISAFNSNGFSVTNGSLGNINTNTNGDNYVAWQWRANAGSTSSNTNGSLTSTVSANTTSGFSVVGFNAGTAGNKTIGHGLGIAPSMIILKQRTGISNEWYTYHKSLGASGVLRLNQSTASTTDTRMWANTSPTSSVFSIETGYTASANSDQISYCFAEIAGFSKFGSYTGNGSTDGPFIYLGFRPKYLMIKVTSTTEDWYVWDSVRGTYNANTPILYPDLANAESTAANDFLSNGFKPRTAQTLQNASGQTYIYAAFAESPFKYANAR